MISIVFQWFHLIHDFIDCERHCWFHVGLPAKRTYSLYIQHHNIISDFVKTLLHFVLKRLQTMPRTEVACYWWELFLNFSTKSICFEDIATCVMGVRTTTWNTSQGCAPLGQVSANSALPRFQHRAHLRPADERITTSCNPARQFLSHNDIIFINFHFSPYMSLTTNKNVMLSMLHFPDSKMGGPAHLRICQERYWVNLRKSANSAIRNHTCPTHSLTIEMKKLSPLEGFGNMIDNSENNYWTIRKLIKISDHWIKSWKKVSLQCWTLLNSENVPHAFGASRSGPPCYSMCFHDVPT